MKPATETIRLILLALLLAGSPGLAVANDAEIIALADELASEKIFQMPGRNDPVLPMLTGIQQTRLLPDAAYDALIVALDNRAMSNRYFALEALAAMPAKDPRYDATVNTISATLATHDHQHTRSTAVDALATLSAKRALPQTALDTLQNTALADPYMTVRMDALELLAGQPLTAAARDRLARSLTAELIQPTSDLWERSRGLRQHRGLPERGVRLLTDWYEHPYPGHVVNAFVAQTQSVTPESSLAVLTEIRARNELTDDQRQRLLEIAARYSYPPARVGIYHMLAEIEAAGAVEDALRIMSTGDTVVARRRAAYGLQAFYRSRPIPAPVAAAADEVMRFGKDVEVIAVAANLVARGPDDREQREAQLIAAMKLHGHDAGIEQALVDLYGQDGLPALVVRYADDESLSPGFRASIIRRLKQSAGPELALDADTEISLRRAATGSSDYWLIDAISDTIKTANKRRSLAMVLKHEETHYLALFVAWITCMLVNLIAGIVALFRVLTGPASGVKRLGLLMLWLFLSAGVLLTAGLAVLSALGHTSTPPVSQVLTWSIPLYVMTFVYLGFTFVLQRLARRDRSHRGEGAYAPAG